MPTLTDKVAVVTGASRGAGRAIAQVLGEAGATVYVTGRSSRAGARTENLSGTVEETAEEVTALAADREIMAKSGQVLTVGDLAREYGFTDVDGRQPPAFRIGEAD